MAEETFTMTQLEDDDDGLDTKYQDYTYQVFTRNTLNPGENPSISQGELVVSYEGEVKQILKIPQYHGADHVNNPGRNYYFFGCFRPYVGGYYLDTRGAGFYIPGEDSIGDYTMDSLGKPPTNEETEIFFYQTGAGGTPKPKSCTFF